MAPKKQSKNKKQQSTPTPQKNCIRCNKDRHATNGYYQSKNHPLHLDGRLPVCKNCVDELVNGDNSVENIKNVLRMLDKAFISDVWISTLAEVERRGFKSVIGMYFKNLALNNVGATWADSDDSYNENKRNDQSNSEKYSDNAKHASPVKIDIFDITDEIIEKWGVGYKNEEYQQFEKKYKKLINNYGEKTALHTEGLLTYIRYRVKEEMATARGDVKESKEWGQLASKAAQDAKINVSQLSKSDISGGVDVLSQLFEAVETEVGVIPLLPRLLEQPYDDADLIIWATVNYNRRLEDKPPVQYKEIYDFYDEMLGEHFKQQGYNDDEVEEFKAKRNNVFRDLSKVYVEPLYEGDGED